MHNFLKKMFQQLCDKPTFDYLPNMPKGEAKVSVRCWFYGNQTAKNP